MISHGVTLTATAHDLAQHPISIVVPPPGPKARALIEAEEPWLSPSLIHCYPLAVKRAAGCMVEDLDGNVFLDCEAGIATAATGHCHPDVAAAIQEQSEILIHICGTDFHYPGYGALCERLARIAPGDNDWRTFLSNSGTEAVEAAIKLARHHTGRPGLIAFRGGFHGRSLGALSLTASKVKYRHRFGPLVPGVYHAHFPRTEAEMERARESIEHDLFEHVVAPDEIAAIVVEPVLGEGGYHVPPPAFLPWLRALADKHGIMLVFDEVQSGLGRTGKMFAAEHFGVVPDAIVLAKGLASGLPLGAMMARRKFMTWPHGSHGSTNGGNPVAIAAALVTLELIETKLRENAARVGGELKQALRETLARSPIVEEVRGLGLMLGVEFRDKEQASRVAQRSFETGLLVLECGKKTVRIAPPLIITREQAEAAVRVFASACAEVAGGA
jgi:4-aminobutyrate aminotransferase